MCDVCVSAWLPSLLVCLEVFMSIWACGSHCGRGVVNKQGCPCEALVFRGWPGTDWSGQNHQAQLKCLDSVHCCTCSFNSLPGPASALSVASPNWPLATLAIGNTVAQYFPWVWPWQTCHWQHQHTPLWWMLQSTLSKRFPNFPQTSTQSKSPTTPGIYSHHQLLTQPRPAAVSVLTAIPRHFVPCLASTLLGLTHSHSCPYR